ncbi:hypothetical protein CHU98_g10667 [Xylaria longipes]|nr:hypothetical protein CHU98_g10667 [Xylaria longipes]
MPKPSLSNPDLWYYEEASENEDGDDVNNQGHYISDAAGITTATTPCYQQQQKTTEKPRLGATTISPAAAYAYRQQEARARARARARAVTGIPLKDAATQTAEAQRQHEHQYITQVHPDRMGLLYNDISKVMRERDEHIAMMNMLRDEHEATVTTLQKQVSKLTCERGEHEATVATLGDKHKATVNTLQEQVSELTRDRRRAMHQYAMLRRNMQVMVRVRPRLLPQEADMEMVDYGRDGDGRVRVGTSSRHTPLVDHLFPPDTADAHVFAEVEDLLYMAMDGIADVCILVYGQTGSGKSHTMGHIVSDAAGKIFRYFQQRTRSRDGAYGDDDIRHDSNGRRHAIAARYVECYQDMLYDLFSSSQLLTNSDTNDDDDDDDDDDDNKGKGNDGNDENDVNKEDHVLKEKKKKANNKNATTKAARKRKDGLQQQHKEERRGWGRRLDLRQDDKTQTTEVIDARVPRFRDAAALLAGVGEADKKRATASTRQNERSSRSHAVLTIYLGVGDNDSSNINHSSSSTDTGTTIQGDGGRRPGRRSRTITFVDLAGSEPSAQHDGAADAKARAQETKKINLSLHELRNVVSQLGMGQRGGTAATSASLSPCPPTSTSTSNTGRSSSSSSSAAGSTRTLSHPKKIGTNTNTNTGNGNGNGNGNGTGTRSRPATITPAPTITRPQPRKHIPYNNSTLTKLLKYSLGFGARTLFIVCVSPLVADVAKTDASLEFAGCVHAAKR